MSASKTFPLNLFGIAFGLSGLAGTWTVAGEKLGIDVGVADAFWILAAVVWAVSVIRYLLGARTVRQLVEDLGHPILGPFAALAAGLIGGQSLSTVGLHSMGIASFAVGILMWLLLGAALTARLAFRPSLPAALIPTIAKLPFGLGFWALTFTTAASGTYGIHWLTISGVALSGLWTVVILAAVTLLIGWIAVRSIVFVTVNHRKTALEPVAAG
jgi:tellurite resistance protein